MQLDDLKITLLWKFLNVLQEIENISRQDIYSKRTILSGQYRRHLLYSWLMTCTAPHYLQTHIFHQGNHLFHIFYLHCFLIYFLHYRRINIWFLVERIKVNYKRNVLLFYKRSVFLCFQKNDKCCIFLTIEPTYLFYTLTFPEIIFLFPGEQETQCL